MFEWLEMMCFETNYDKQRNFNQKGTIKYHVGHMCFVLT